MANSFTGNIIPKQKRAHFFISRGERLPLKFRFPALKWMCRIRGSRARGSSALHGGEPAERAPSAAAGGRLARDRRVPASGTACCLPLAIKILSGSGNSQSSDAQKETLRKACSHRASLLMIFISDDLMTLRSDDFNYDDLMTFVSDDFRS